MYLTFGKYYNKSIKEVLKRDNQYSQWLITQPWFKIKYEDLYNSFVKEMDDFKKENLQINDKDKDIFVIYTDGACKHNGSEKAKAGLGVHFSEKNIIKINDISEKLNYKTQTNNAAELMAILLCLEKCKEYNIQQKIYIYTDSNYSINCITIWYPEWIKKGNYENRKNIDILHKINNIYQNLNIKINHVRAHTKLNDIHSLGNEIADKLAVSAIS